MNIVLATGIYPPQIGGPATYVRGLAREFTEAGHRVTIVTYAPAEDAVGYAVHAVPLGLPIIRWFRYASMLRRVGKDADVVYAFSSVSAGVPVMLSGFAWSKKTVLRLGGDFGWERATDRGSTKTLREWCASRPFVTRLMERLLRGFTHIVFSSAFQQRIYTETYGELPSSVIHNPLPSAVSTRHEAHTPFQLLFFGRFVAFKNLPALLDAVKTLSDVRLTLVGDGPLRGEIDRWIEERGLRDRVVVRLPVDSEQKRRVFDEHDLLVLPSLTEISPNAALEARATGLPVLLTEETGLDPALLDGIVLADLRDADGICAALTDVRARYPQIADQAAGFTAPPGYGWSDVCSAHVSLFSRL